MATTRYYYSTTQTSYVLSNITKENHPNPNNLVYFYESYIYGNWQYTPFHYTTNLATPCRLVAYPDGGMFPSGYFFGSPNEIGMPPSPPNQGAFELTIPAGNYIYLPTYYSTAEVDQPVYTECYGSQDYWVIPPASHSYSTINSNLTSTYMGENVDGFDVCADDQMLVYYCATDVVFNCYSNDIAFSGSGGYISYVSGTLQLVKGDVGEQTNAIYTVKTSSSYDYTYGNAKGSYSLEPSSVAITTTSLQAGKSATISVSRGTSTGSNASTYGFPITYKYQYSTNGGTSWTDIASSTATSYSFTIPSGVSAIMVQVIPSDSLGTGSAVTSSSYTVQQSKTYVGVSGVVRIASVKVCTGGAVRNANAYSCKDGVIKQT